MAALLILAVLFLVIAVAEWRDWVPDTRTGTDWLPRSEAEHRRAHS